MALDGSTETEWPIVYPANLCRLRDEISSMH